MYAQKPISCWSRINRRHNEGSIKILSISFIIFYLLDFILFIFLIIFYLLQWRW